MATIWYRTKDGMTDYKFSIEYCRTHATYHIFILEQPSYMGADESTSALTRSYPVALGYSDPC